MAEGIEEHGKSFAAPLIFTTVVIFQLISGYIKLSKRKGRSEEEIKLRAEIKEILKEARTYSQPSTFAQAAKLKRMAAVKERELAKVLQLPLQLVNPLLEALVLETHGREIKLSYDSHRRRLIIAKAVIYIVLIIWFWRFPVAAIPERLVQPFGKILSWRAGVSLNDHVMVGIIPWLILSTRVGKIISRKVLSKIG